MAHKWFPLPSDFKILELTNATITDEGTNKTLFAVHVVDEKNNALALLQQHSTRDEYLMQYTPADGWKHLC